MNQGLAGKAKAEAARQALAEGMELSFIESWNSDDSATGQSE
jgi:hypothetical protein